MNSLLVFDLNTQDSFRFFMHLIGFTVYLPGPGIMSHFIPFLTSNSDSLKGYLFGIKESILEGSYLFLRRSTFCCLPVGLNMVSSWSGSFGILVAHAEIVQHHPVGGMGRKSGRLQEFSTSK